MKLCLIACSIDCWSQGRYSCFDLFDYFRQWESEGEKKAHLFFFFFFVFPVFLLFLVFLSLFQDLFLGFFPPMKMPCFNQQCMRQFIKLSIFRSKSDCIWLELTGEIFRLSGEKISSCFLWNVLFSCSEVPSRDEYSWPNCSFKKDYFLW